MGVLLLAATGAVAGRPESTSVGVRDRFGRSLSGIVQLCDLATDPCSSIELMRTDTGVILPRPVSKERIRVSCPGFVNRDLEILGTDLEITLEASAGAELRFLGEGLDGSSVDVLARLAGERLPAAMPFFSKRVSIGPEGARLTIPDLPPGEYEVSWEGPNVLPGKTRIRVDGNATVEKTMSLQKGVVLRGSVHDDVGASVSGARVLLETGSRADPRRTAVSGPDGSFELLSVPVGEPRGYRVQADGHLRARGVWGGETRLEVVMERSSSVFLRILSARGAPIEGARIAPRYGERETLAFGSAVVASDAEGRVRLGREEKAQLTLVISAPGHTEREVPVPTSREDLDLGDVALDEGRTVTGRVISKKTGTAVPGAMVLIDGAERGGIIPTAPLETTTDGEGRFLIEGLRKEDATVRVKAAGFAQVQRRLSASESSIEILIGGEGRLEVVVCGTPEEIAGSVVSCRPQLPGVRAETLRVDASGRAVFESLEAGPMACSRLWRFQRPSGNFVTGSYASARDVTVPEGGTGTLRLGCDGPVLSGVLVAGGRPFASANGGARHQGTKETVSFATDAAGRFSFRVPAPGVYDIQLFYVGGQPVAPGSLGGASCEVGAGGRVGIELELKK